MQRLLWPQFSPFQALRNENPELGPSYKHHNSRTRELREQNSIRSGALFRTETGAILTARTGRRDKNCFIVDMDGGSCFRLRPPAGHMVRKSTAYRQVPL